jgi:leader peptidase (prepilin peptidase)/N-methyltransferase
VTPAAAVAVALPLVAAGAALPRLVAAFPPHEGEPHTSPHRAVLVAAHAAVVCAVAVRLRCQPAWLPAFLAAASGGTALAIIDLRAHRLPDRITLPAYPLLAALLAVAAAVDGDAGRWLRAAAAAAVVGLAFLLLWALPASGLGLGDVKLAGLLGLVLGWLGWPALAAGLFAGVLLGGVVALVLLAARRAERGTPIAYGPFLLAGGLLVLLAGGW